MIYDASKQRKRRMDAAQGYLILELPDLALRELNALAQAEKTSYEYFLLRGEVLRAKDEYHTALEAYLQAHTESPEDLHVLLGMAWCYKRIDRVDQAIETMRLAHESHQNVPIILYNIACYYALAGEKENALSWLGRALRRDPSLLDLIPDETDFESLRHDPDFAHLLTLTAK